MPTKKKAPVESPKNVIPQTKQGISKETVPEEPTKTSTEKTKEDANDMDFQPVHSRKRPNKATASLTKTRVEEALKKAKRETDGKYKLIKIDCGKKEDIVLMVYRKKVYMWAGS